MVTFITSGLYVHTAWADSADGSEGFVLVYDAEKAFVGTFVDDDETESTNKAKYAWVALNAGADTDSDALLDRDQSTRNRNALENQQIDQDFTLETAQEAQHTAQEAQQNIDNALGGYSSISWDVSGGLVADEVSVDSAVFVPAVVDEGTYTFVYNGTTWDLDNVAVDIADYGIEINDGYAAASGDSIVIAYEAIEGVNDKVSAAQSAADSAVSATQMLASEVESNAASIADLQASQSEGGADVDALQAAVVSLESSVTTELAERAARMTFGQDTQGNPILTLGGGADADLAVNITNSQIQFVDTGTVVAFITGQLMSIGNAKITQQLQFGDFAFIPRTGGNLCLKYVGA